MTFEDVRVTDPTVREGMEAKIGAEAIIVLLVEQKIALFKRIIELEAIAPKAYRVDGKLLVWRCPDDLIPVSNL